MDDTLKIIIDEEDPNDYEKYLTILNTIIDSIDIFKNKPIELNFNKEMNSPTSQFQYNIKNNTPNYILNIAIQYTNTEDIETVNNLNEIPKYFEMYKICKSDQTIATWIFMLLHELGHIEYFIKYYSSKSIINKMNRINNIEYELLHAIFKTKSNKKRQKVYYMSRVELHANQFTYKHFPHKWELLKTKGLI